MGPAERPRASRRRPRSDAIGSSNLRWIITAGVLLSLLEPAPLQALGHVLYAGTASVRPLVGRGSPICMSSPGGRQQCYNRDVRGDSSGGVFDWIRTRTGPLWGASDGAISGNGGDIGGVGGSSGNGGKSNGAGGSDADGSEPADGWAAPTGGGGRGGDAAVRLNALLAALRAILSSLLAPLRALWNIYTALLLSHPLLTKALTAGLIAFLGDLGAQLFEHSRFGGASVGAWVSDKRRSMAVVIDGVFLTGPGLHFLYGMLEATFPTSGGKLPAAVPAALHVLFDTFIFDPLFVCSFFCMTGMLEQRPLLNDVVPQLKREYWPALRGSWGVSVLFWPVQYWTFRFMPLQFRVMAVNLCDVCWTATLSFFSHRDHVPVAGTPPAPPPPAARAATKRAAAPSGKLAKAGA